MKYSLHVQNWKDCDACDLSESRTKTVFFRGDWPCDVLFIGEAPGDSEDMIGSPFVGPAGNLLNTIIARATEIAPEVRYGITNLVACRPPRDEERKQTPPDYEAIQTCGERLRECVNAVKPSALIAIGNLACKWLDAKYEDVPYAHDFGIDSDFRWEIVHPAYILAQLTTINQKLVTQKCVITVAECFRAISDLIETRRTKGKENDKQSRSSKANRLRKRRSKTQR